MAATEDERRLYRINGVAVRHCDMERDRLKALGREDRPSSKDEQEALACGGHMVQHGEKLVRDDGTFYVDWQGDAMFDLIACAECGFETTVATDYRRAKVMERQGMLA